MALVKSAREPKSSWMIPNTKNQASLASLEMSWWALRTTSFHPLSSSFLQWAAMDTRGLRSSSRATCLAAVSSHTWDLLSSSSTPVEYDLRGQSSGMSSSRRQILCSWSRMG